MFTYPYSMESTKLPIIVLTRSLKPYILTSV
jgi:hypothetical protein